MTNRGSPSQRACGARARTLDHGNCQGQGEGEWGSWAQSPGGGGGARAVGTPHPLTLGIRLSSLTDACLDPLGSSVETDALSASKDRLSLPFSSVSAFLPITSSLELSLSSVCSWFANFWRGTLGLLTFCSPLSPNTSIRSYMFLSKHVLPSGIFSWHTASIFKTGDT